MSTLKQVLRYGLIGVLVNSAGYLVYLGVTGLGADPKLSAGVLYPVGVLLGFFGHGNYSFSYRGRLGQRLPYFFGAHCIGYVTNLALLYLMHDRLRWPHQIVQLLAIGIVAGELFLLMRYLVFPHGATERTSP